MTKKQNHIISDDLITRYLFGKVSRQEADMVINALKDEHIRKDFLIRKNLLDEVYFHNIENEMDTQHSLQHLLAKIDGATILPNQRKTIHFPTKQILRVAAVLIGIIGIALIWKLRTPNQHTIASGNEVVANIVLPDSSTMWLNTETEISYPEQFKGTLRKVELHKGEVSFNIKHNKQQPFIVHTQQLQVEVLGTEFNVKLNENSQETVVSVQNGQIKIHFLSKDYVLVPVILNAGEKCVYKHTTSRIDTGSNPNPNDLTWKTGLFVFSKSPLQDALSIIAQHFNYKLKIQSKSVINCQVTASLDASNLETILETLELSGNFYANIKSDTIYISGEGCKPLSE